MLLIYLNIVTLVQSTQKSKMSFNLRSYPNDLLTEEFEKTIVLRVRVI